MTLGAGIALAAVWGFAIACTLSKQVTGLGMWLGVIASLVATYFIAH